MTMPELGERKMLPPSTYERYRTAGKVASSTKPFRCIHCGWVKLIKTDHVEDVYTYCPNPYYASGCDHFRLFKFDPHQAIIMMANGGKLKKEQ